MAAKNSSQQSPNIDINTPYTPRRPSPIVSISINHPIAGIFRKIKNFLIHKQTLFSTTFSIKITPIVAIVSLFGLAGLFGGGITTAFTIGKTVEQKFLASMPTPTPRIIITTPVPSPVIVSREGTIKATYQLPPATPTLMPTATPFPGAILEGNASLSAVPTYTPSITPKPTPPTLHYILVSHSGSLVFLTSGGTVHLQNYAGLRVLITGSLDSTKNTLTIAKPEDIEILQ